MKIRHRIAYEIDTISDEFVKYLNSQNAIFEKTNTDIGVAFIYEEGVYIDELYDYYHKENITPIIDVIYTKEEYDKAEWYTMRSKFRFEYPQPEDDYIGITYNDKEFCPNCGFGLIQKSSFQISKAPKWGKCNFLMLNWIEDELFVNAIVKDVFESEKIIGLKFLEVLKYRKEIAIEDIYQIYIKNELEPGLINIENSVKIIRKCNSCNRKKYIGSGKGLTFKREVFNHLSSDIYKTYEAFGDGLMHAKVIIVSKKLYNAIKKYNLDKKLEFEPISIE